MRSGISACLRKTLPRQTRHNIRSNATIRSRGTTPVINLNQPTQQQHLFNSI